MRRLWWVALGYLPLVCWLAAKATIAYYSNVDGCMADDGSAEGCFWWGVDIDHALMRIDDGLPWDLALVVVPATAVWTVIVAMAVVISARRRSHR